MKNKNSPTDVIPTEVLKNCVDVFSMALSHLANLSFASSVFPRAFKIGHVSPLLKKKGLDIKDPANYRPITNLSTISKILEKLALARIKSNVHASQNFGSFKSAYRAGHSTETALLRITNDLNTSMDKKVCNTLLSLDISVAFDTIDHDVLVQRLNTDFGITDSASKWFQSYLSGRSCYVSVGGSRSCSWTCDSGVPQGSVLGSVLFSVFVSPVSRIFHHFGIRYHQYADDTQLYTEIDPRVGIRSDDLTSCVESVTHWFLLNGLQLNANKTEAIVFGTRQQLDHCQQYSLIQICGADVKVSQCIKTLGVHLDATLSMDVQVSETVKACNFHLRSLRHVRKCLTLDSAKTIACGLVAAKLDYCNSLLSGTSKGNLMRLQRAQNDLARVVLQRK